MDACLETKVSEHHKNLNLCKGHMIIFKEFGRCAWGGRRLDLAPPFVTPAPVPKHKNGYISTDVQRQ